jgi:hypothetical protein
MKIDVTDIFWNLLEKILIFDYDVVRESTEYEQISLYINSSDTFILKIDENTQIETSDVNHLFYKTKNIYEKKFPFSKRCQLLEKVISKMEKHVNTEHEIDHLFDNFKF